VPTDAAQLHDAIVESIEHLIPWMPWASLEPLDLSDRQRLIADGLTRWNRGEDFNYGVFESAVLVGGCGLHRRVGPAGLEIGYWTRVSAVRRGVASEAARCLVDGAFSMPDIDFVEVHHDIANVASGRIPERLGFRLVEERWDGIEASAEVGVERIWRLHRDAWRASTTRG
jgi:RimJ/RimL family protein N-acetyltransferase